MSLTRHLNTIFAITIIPLLLSCGSTETLSTYQHDSEIEIDGNLSNWPASDSNIHNSDSFSYYVMQDNDNLYIYVDFKSPFYNHSVDNSGFILYLNENENAKKSRGIGYPSGAFNLLREDPAAYGNLTRDPEWLGNVQNQRRLESMQEENFNQIMIVERFDNSSDTNYGFVTYSQIEAQGVKLAAARDRRHYGLEFKLPLDGSAPFELEKGKTYWLGFAIEPPEFSFRDDTNMQQHNQRSNQYYGQRRGARSRSSSVDRRVQLRRQLGQYEEWFKISIE